MKKSVLTEIVGTWKLKSIFYLDGAANEINLYGEDPVGVLMYDRFGYMNAQLGSSNRKNQLVNETISDTDKVKLFDAYIAYFGKYFETEPGVIIHKVEGCTNPAWEGKDEIRYVSIDKDILYITTPGQEIAGILTKLEVYWHRIS